MKFFFQFEEAAKEVADEITRPRFEGEEEVQDIQITLRSNANPILLRDLKVIFLIFLRFFISPVKLELNLGLGNKKYRAPTKSLFSQKVTLFFFGHYFSKVFFLRVLLKFPICFRSQQKNNLFYANTST